MELRLDLATATIADLSAVIEASAVAGISRTAGVRLEGTVLVLTRDENSPAAAAEPVRPPASASDAAGLGRSVLSPLTASGLGPVGDMALKTLLDIVDNSASGKHAHGNRDERH